MGFFGKLNTLAQNTLGGFLAKVGRLDDWRPDTPPDNCDYEALWREAISAFHPILDARVRLRVAERNTENHYACSAQPISGEIDALDADLKAALAAEALKRFVFLDYCVYFHFNKNSNRPLDALNNFGLSKDKLVALESDFNCLTQYLFLRVQPRLNAEQTENVARVVGFLASGNPTNSTIRSLLYQIKPVLLTHSRMDERKLAALQDLFVRLGEGAHLIGYVDTNVIALVEALAVLIGASPETHPIIRAKREKEALIAEGKQAVVTLAGPRIAALFEKSFKQAGPTPFATTGDRSVAEDPAVATLSPAGRGQTLFDCLRVFNFMSHCGQHPSTTAWPECKLSGFDGTKYPNIRESSDLGATGAIVQGLIQHLVRKKLELNEGMQSELLNVLRSGAAPRLIQSLSVVKIVEGFAKGNSSAGVRAELEATIAWLGKSNGYQVKEFKAAALYQLEKALESMAPRGEAGSPAEAEPDAAPALKSSPAVHLPGGFGRRATPPAEGKSSVPAAEPPAAAQMPRDTAPLAPPRTPDSSGRPISIVDFYGDLADLRKCSPEHIAFLDEQIAGETDVEAEARRRIAIRPMLRGLTEEQQANAHAAIRADVVREREQYRALMEMLKARVLVVARVAGGASAIWAAFHDHARTLYGKSKPPAAWLKRAHEILGAMTADTQVAMVRAAAGGYPCYGAHHPTDDVVRGLVYCAARLPADKVGTAIADFARKECFQTVAGSGIRDKRMGNACLWALIHMPEGAGVPYLARLLNRVKYPSVKKTINAALDEAAEAAGLSRGALDELSVPTHDLEDGRVEIAIGPDGGAALLEIVGTADVSIAFRRADGKTTASVPTELKAFKSVIAQARSTAKEIEADLTTQIARLQRIWLENRDWSFADWDARYARHPLLTALAKRLIWDVATGDKRTSAVLIDGSLTDIEGKLVDAANARISLWHPIGRPLPEVLGWRKRLSELGIVQPFKQAHREVYYVTDAERATGIYSNRFAGHILRQHQMMTLARLNHWNVTHRIWADVRNDEPTHLVIPAWNIVAELWTEGTGGDNPEVSDSAAYLFISTNQVRFYSIKGNAKVSAAALGPARGEAVRMEAVPEIVFSEVMRHCDLFTSVASVANDPNWIDSGADAQHPDQWRRTVDDYWRNTALGDLSQSAASRKEVITALLPSLKIADRCRIDGNYLHVQGKLRAYKIHFGSGNILMEPDSRYICIVQGTPKGSGVVMLPFEGDTMLSLILSKALLLADDDRIKDAVITRQIYR